MTTQIELNNIIASSGNFLTALQINGTGVTISGHSHTTSDISNFNTSVSGLINGTYAAISGASFSGTISAPTGNFTGSIQVGNNILTSTDILNMINSTNLYLWSNFR